MWFMIKVEVYAWVKLYINWKPYTQLSPPHQSTPPACLISPLLSAKSNGKTLDSSWVTYFLCYGIPVQKPRVWSAHAFERGASSGARSSPGLSRSPACPCSCLTGISWFGWEYTMMMMFSFAYLIYHCQLKAFVWTDFDFAYQGSLAIWPAVGLSGAPNWVFSAVSSSLSAIIYKSVNSIKLHPL